MDTKTIVMCVVALILGMLMANMLKSVCGCKTVVEGAGGAPDRGLQAVGYDCNLTAGCAFDQTRGNPSYCSGTLLGQGREDQKYSSSGRAAPGGKYRRPCFWGGDQDSTGDNKKWCRQLLGNAATMAAYRLCTDKGVVIGTHEFVKPPASAPAPSPGFLHGFGEFIERNDPL